MNLIIDIGNTLSKCFLVDDGRIVSAQKHEHISVAVLRDLLDQHPRVNRGISLSTGGECNEICQYLASRLHYFIRLDHLTPVPIANQYLTPHTLGLDRLAGAVGACSLFPGSKLIVFDFGTAITIDFIENNCFCGGNISPGLQTRFRALHHFTQRLPLCSIDDGTPKVGHTTSEAIRAGVQFGVIAEIEAYIRCNKDYKILFTGGDTIFFAEKIKSPIFVVPNLIVMGLDRIMEYNVSIQQHG